MVPVSSSDEITRRLARQAELPSSTLVSYWPEPRFCGHALRGRRHSKPVASVGLEFVSRWGDSLIGTAGHFGLVTGDELFITNKRRPFRRRFIGAISWVLDPSDRLAGANRLDAHQVAFSTLHLQLRNDDWQRTPVVPPAEERSVDEGDLCEWDGAASGYTRGDVVGALRTIEVEGVRLRNCWYLARDSREGGTLALLY